MRDLAWIITSNAAAAGREAAEADARGDRAEAARIFENNCEAEDALVAPGVPVALAPAAYRAFISAYCQERQDSDLAPAKVEAYVVSTLNRRPLGGR